MVPAGVANDRVMSCVALERVPKTGDPSEPRRCNPSGCADLCTEQGLAAAHRKYRGRLFARARLVVVDPGLAEDAVQEAFVRAWRSCSSFDPTAGPVVNWLLVITRNVAIDLVKARLRRPPLAPPTPDDRLEPVDDGISEADHIVLRAELAQALAQIGADHRTALVETILRDRPYDEVAAELGVPAGTLRSRVHYGLKRLRAHLETTSEAA